LVSIELQADFSPLIKREISLIKEMNDNNITKEEIRSISKRQQSIYTEAIESFLLNKERLLISDKLYTSEIFLLKNIIKYNKRHGYKNDVLRDEILIKSYNIIQSDNQMAKDILRSLDYYSLGDFGEKMNDKFVKNQLEVEEIINRNPKIDIDDSRKFTKEVREKIVEYKAILEIHNDISNYFAINKERIYRLNKYSNYHILPIALYIDNLPLGRKINSLLSRYNISIMKIILMIFISSSIYLFRTRLYKVLELIFLKINFFRKYSEEIVEDIRIPINYILIAINLEITIYIYHNFNSVDILSKGFNIIYAFLSTIILYRILNTVASIKIVDIEQSNTTIKREMVNVGIKISNFLVLILGVLLVLHFAGANLTTVLSGLGIGGFAIALAARESLSNFLGTISILMSDIFSQGDWIEVGDKDGTVVEIGLRVTTLRTFDNALIAIPNGTIANQDIKNWSRRTLGRRIKLSLGIKYDSKPQDIKNAISQIREMLQTHPNIATEKSDYTNHTKKSSKLVSQEDALGVKRTLFVYLDEFSDSSINILVYCFTKKTIWGQWLETKEDILYKIMDILERNSLEFAFPSISLYSEGIE
jgi:MscS family membrane protein